MKCKRFLRCFSSVDSRGDSNMVLGNKKEIRDLWKRTENIIGRVSSLDLLF